MRFVPHLDATLQSSTTPWDHHYYTDSDSEVESNLGADDNHSLGESSTTSGSDKEGSIAYTGKEQGGETEQLPDFLTVHGLHDRFNMACSLAENNHLFNPPISKSTTTGENNKIYEQNEDADEGNDTNESSEDTALSNHSSLAKYYVSRFAEARAKRSNTVQNLIKEEEERKRKAEEERLRKIEEERRRKEEAARKAREEEEKRRLAELKRIEEEKKRKEQEEKARQEALKAQEQLRLKKQKEAELVAKAEAEAKKAAELERAKNEAAKMIIKPKEIEASFLKYTKDIKDINSQVVDPMNKNKELKKAAGSHKRKINPKFGQLTNSQRQLTRITNEINDLVLQTKQNDLVYKWILNFISDAIISQAETEVSVKPKASIPLAKLTLNLLILFEELSYFLLAKFYTACPFLLGYSCPQDTEEGRTRLGWNRDEDTGKWENEVQYNERLSGISTLFSVITRLKLDSTYIGYNSSTTKHPLPISNSWIFLARMVDVPATELTETHYTIVGAWWDACSIEFLQAYGKQSRKLLQLVVDEWSSLGDKSSAGKVRLKLLGEEWAQGKMQSFPLMEP